jgi:hypothetical protein
LDGLRATISSLIIAGHALTGIGGKAITAAALRELALAPEVAELVLFGWVKMAA